jgi:hypothetical protein
MRLPSFSEWIKNREAYAKFVDHLYVPPLNSVSMCWSLWQSYCSYKEWYFRYEKWLNEEVIIIP